MGAVPDFGSYFLGATSLLGSVLGMTESHRASKEQAAAQQAALNQQKQAQDQQLALQREQQNRTLLQNQMQINKSQKDIASAAAAISNTPTVTNQANLTGGLGVPTSSLALGGTSSLGTSSLSDLLGDLL